MACAVESSDEDIEELLRRKRLQKHPESITIPRNKYDELLQHAEAYRTLRLALIDGGVSLDSLNTLARTNTTPGIPGDPQQRSRHNEQPERNIIATPNTSSTSPAGTPHHPSKPAFEFFETDHFDRSLALHNIADSTSLLDVVGSIRGGAILSIIMNRSKKTAYVTFVKSDAAVEFKEYAKQSNLHINGNKTIVKWDQYQKCLSGYLARRIFMDKATRNLAIRFIKPGTTVTAIQHDLAHIHQLQVLHVKIEKSHAFVYTNNVRLAITAKTCLSSQLKYKGSRIEFFPDECDAPLPMPMPMPMLVPAPKISTQQVIKKQNGKTPPYRGPNRFAPLDEDVSATG